MKRFLGILLFVFLVVHFCAAQADSTAKEKEYAAPWFVQKYQLSVGTFIPISNTQIKVGLTNANTGTQVDFESDLGFNTTIGTIIADFQYRLHRRSRFDLTYYHINRSSTKTLTKDINFGENTYHANTTVGAFFNTNIYRFSWGYSVIEKQKFELGFLIGAHIINTSAELNANGTNTSVSVKDEFGVTAPLPDLGIFGGYAFSDRFAVNGEIDFLAVKIGDIKGRILGGSVSFLYRLSKQFDLAAGYTGLNVKVDATKPKFTGNFKWGYNGPSLTASFWFGKKYWGHKN